MEMRETRERPRRKWLSLLKGESEQPESIEDVTDKTDESLLVMHVVLDLAHSDFDAIPPGWQKFHSIPCRASPDGWAEFASLRATPQGPLLCVHCGEVHKEAR
jgi:hypothetical protein